MGLHLTRAGRGGRMVVALGCAAAFVLVGCSEQDGPRSSRSGYDGQVPDFSGPWAAEFAEMYRQTTTDFEREVLDDEVVTDQELAEVQSRYVTCLTDLGYTDISFDSYGGGSLTQPDGVDDQAMDEQVLECSNQAGESTVGALYWWIRRNPENLDEGTIIAACLVREGVVDPSYSGRDYDADWGKEGSSIRFRSGVSAGAGEAAEMKCTVDPLGLFE